MTFPLNSFISLTLSQSLPRPPRLAHRLPRRVDVKTLTLALIVIALSAAPARAQRLSLADAIALGLEHNRTLANTALQVEKAEQEIAIARTRRLPNLKVEAQATQLLRPIDIMFPRGSFGTYDGIGPLPATDARIRTSTGPSYVIDAQATQPLTQLFKLNLNVQLSEASRELQREQLRDAQLTLVSSIKRAYYAIVKTQSALEANERSVTLLQELDRVVGDRLIQRVALKSDALATGTRLARAEVSGLELRHALASQKEQLNQLIGRDLRTDLEVETMPDATLVELDLAAAQTRALAARPDIQQARLKQQQAQLARRAAKADYLPDVALNVSYYSPMNVSGAPRHIASGAIQMQWEPFDWGRKGRTLAEKDLEIRQAANNVHDAEERAVLEINSRFRGLEAARARLRLARMSEESARESARISLTQYGAHGAIFADVLQAQSAVADADHQYQEALETFWSARADFERAMAEELNR